MLNNDILEQFDLEFFRLEKRAASVDAAIKQKDREKTKDLNESSTISELPSGMLHPTNIKLALALAKRESLKSSQFAVPEAKAKKIGVSGEIVGEAKGKYPVDTTRRAKNALSRVSQFGTPAERAAVRLKVYRKYPELREGFEERHGESPTAKKNLKKVEQGGIGKEAKIQSEDESYAKNEALAQALSRGGLIGAPTGAVAGGVTGLQLGRLIGGRPGAAVGGILGNLVGGAAGTTLGTAFAYPGAKRRQLELLKLKLEQERQKNK